MVILAMMITDIKMNWGSTRAIAMDMAARVMYMIETNNLTDLSALIDSVYSIWSLDELPYPSISDTSVHY